MPLLISLALTCVLYVSSASAFLPIRPELRQVPMHPPRGCLFGGQSYHAIGSSWHPHLGNTFGIMQCFTCHCVQVKSSAAMTSRTYRDDDTTKVTCHDVRKDCEVLTCKGAKVPRGECCKVCPEEDETNSKNEGASSKSPEDFPIRSIAVHGDKAFNDEDAKSSGEDLKTKKYVALLTSTDGGALLRATFTLHRGNLHFTVHHKYSSQPSKVELLNDEGSKLYDHVSTESPKRGQAVVCGVWRNLPKHVINSLDRKSLQLRAVFDNSAPGGVNNSTSLGRVMKHRALVRETFSALLTTPGNPHDGIRGALVMVTLGRQRFNKLHFAVLFRQNNSESSQLKEVSLQLINKEGKVLRSMEKLSQETELADVWPTDPEILRGLGDGSLTLALRIGDKSSRDDTQRFEGALTARISCDLLQAVLSGSGCAQRASTGAAGSAVLTVHENSTVSYKVSLVGLSSDVTSISLLGDYRKKRTRVIADLTAPYAGGVSEGVLESINGKELHLLLSDHVRLSVETVQSNSGELGGEVLPFLYGGHLARYRGLPVPLAGALVRPPVFTGSAGHAWLELNEECHLYYEIVVSGLSTHSDSTAAVHLHGLAELSGSDNSGHKQLLKGFYGKEARGILREMTASLYDQLNKGTAFIQIATKRNPDGEIRGRVHIPNQCSQMAAERKTDSTPSGNVDRARPITSRHRDVTAMPAVFSDVNALVHDGAAPVMTQRRLEMQPLSCYSEGRWRADKSQWAPSYDTKCTRCVCEGGSVVCDPVQCPRLSCERPVVLEDRCCPVCNDGLTGTSAKEESLPIGSLFPSSFHSRRPAFGAPLTPAAADGCVDEQDGKVHPYGSSWRPFFPMFGLVACLNCTCSQGGKVTCGKVTCPPVTCAFPRREGRNQCCKTCPGKDSPRRSFRLSSAAPPRGDRHMQDDSGRGMCPFGRDIYAPGERWSVNLPGLPVRRGAPGRRLAAACIACECVFSPRANRWRHKCKRSCPPISEACSRATRSATGCCAWRCQDDGAPGS